MFCSMGFQERLKYFVQDVFRWVVTVIEALWKPYIITLNSPPVVSFNFVQVDQKNFLGRTTLEQGRVIWALARFPGGVWMLFCGWGPKPCPDPAWGRTGVHLFSLYP